MSCALGAAAAAPAPRASPRAPRVKRDLTRSSATTQRHGGGSSCAAGSARRSRVSSAPRFVSGIARRSRASARRGTRAFAKVEDGFEDDFEGADELETTGAPVSGSKGGTAKAERTASDRATDRSGASPGAPKPPERDTGIKRERDMSIDFEAEERNEVDAEGNAYFLKSGVDEGDDGYRCRWTVQGRTSRDGVWEHRETHWEKADARGYKELGAELSGFNEEGDTWWETWREVYRPGRSSSYSVSSASSSSGAAGDDDESERIERSADKWARDATGKEWHEKWWEKFEASGASERSVEKSGRQGIQAWWEKWGEQTDEAGPGAETIKWTDKWAENGAGTRWGDKWEERFSSEGAVSKKVGETWRVGAGGERWSRTWGETIGKDGEVRKYGQSTSGERWDTVEAPAGSNRERTNGANFDANETSDDRQNENENGDGFGDAYGWEDALADSARLLAIDIGDDGTNA